MVASNTATSRNKLSGQRVVLESDDSRCLVFLHLVAKWPSVFFLNNVLATKPRWVLTKKGLGVARWSFFQVSTIGSIKESIKICVT